MDDDHEEPATHQDDPNELLRRDLDDWSVEAASCVLVSPLLLFAEWLNELPEPVRSEVAKEAGRFLSDDPLYLELHEEEDPAARLLALYFHAPEEPNQTLRRLFVICGAVDLLTFQYRATADDWSVKADELQRFRTPAMRAYMQKHGIPIPTPEEDAKRTRLWIESAASWQRLRNSVLGNEALSCWYEIATWQQG